MRGVVVGNSLIYLSKEGGAINQGMAIIILRR